MFEFCKEFISTSTNFLKCTENNFRETEGSFCLLLSFITTSKLVFLRNHGGNSGLDICCVSD